MRMQLLETNAEPSSSTAIVAVQLSQPDQHPVAVYLASLALGSRRTMKQALSVVANLVAPGSTVEFFPWETLGFQHVAAIRSRLAETYSPTTANKVLAAVRGVLKAAFSLGLIDAETYTRAASIKSVRGERVVKGRALVQDEFRAMFTACNMESPSGTRDAALLAVTYGLGLRRHEVVGLNLTDYDRRSGTLIIRGKGSKERKAYVTNGTRSALETWLAIRGAAEGPIFLPVAKSQQIEMRRMSAQAVYLILARLAAKANVEKFSPHDLRSYLPFLTMSGNARAFAGMIEITGQIEKRLIRLPDIVFSRLQTVEEAQ